MSDIPMGQIISIDMLMATTIDTSTLIQHIFSLNMQSSQYYRQHTAKVDKLIPLQTVRYRTETALGWHKQHRCLLYDAQL